MTEHTHSAGCCAPHPANAARVAIDGVAPAARSAQSQLPISADKAELLVTGSLITMDPSQPLGSPFGFTQIDPNTGLPAPMANTTADYGWEYTWHCHILGHEENDFMRPIVFHANEAVPAAATGLTAASSGTQACSPRDTASRSSSSLAVNS